MWSEVVSKTEYDALKEQYQKFKQLVFKMRGEQKRYFRHRSPDALDQAKKLEKIVDTEVVKPVGQTLVQTTIFDTPDGKGQQEG